MASWDLVGEMRPDSSCREQMRSAEGSHKLLRHGVTRGNKPLTHPPAFIHHHVNSSTVQQVYEVFGVRPGPVQGRLESLTNKQSLRVILLT
jgi:hypothetical protein